jgi:hypothetical protein
MKFSIDLKDSDIEKLINNALAAKVAEVVNARVSEIVETVLLKKVERAVDIKFNDEAMACLRSKVQAAMDTALGPAYSRERTIKDLVSVEARKLIKGAS